MTPVGHDPLEDLVNHPLLGRRVRVALTADETVAGVLVQLTEGGSFHIRLDDGQMRYCWPALDITEEPRTQETA